VSHSPSSSQSDSGSQNRPAKKSLKLPLLLGSALLAFGLPAAWSQQSYQYPFQNPNLPVEQRVDDIVSRLTLDEKIHCLGTHPDVPRLGIRGTGHVEGLHGLALGGPGGWEGRDKNGQRLAVIPTTQFPQARGLGQTWDPALLEQAAAEEGLETRYAWQSPKYQRGGLVVRAPNADLSRDPRWGRSEESYGEDPYLVGTLAVAFVKGLQGNDARYWQTASLMKHFLANSNEDGRGGSSSNFDERLFHEYYAVPFRMGIEQGGSDAFMTAYNAWNGIPIAANPVLRDVVMKDWGFNGIICTDAGALTNMVTLHKYYPDMPHAAAGAIHAGINQFLDRYQDPVRQAYSQKLITDAEIDQNLKGVFRVMIRLGMLDPAAGNPYAKIGEDAAGQDPWERPEPKALARKVTDESIVLLKNERDTLPLDSGRLKSIAVIGPYADQVLLDWYSGTPPYSVSPLEGIRRRAGSGVKVEFAKGDDVPAAVALAKRSDVVIAVVGNHPTCDAGWAKCPSPSDGKEAIDRKSLTLQQEPLVEQLFAANPHTVVVLNASFPFTANWTQAHIPAIVEMTHNSEEEGDGLADVLFGDYDPAGRLTQTWPTSMGDLPPMMDYDIRHGRTYMYAKAKPLYAFGYGLSYTSFRYGNLRVSGGEIHPGSHVDVSVDVTNTGKRAGDEVVQMYVRHQGSKVERPAEELKGFARVAIEPGQTRTITLPLSADSLRYWDEAQHGWVLEPDTVLIRVGGGSNEIRAEQTVRVQP
jgi:beta-glucosidase